jgi:enoyl-CoA hydratase/carnithine racemase
MAQAQDGGRAAVVTDPAEVSAEPVVPVDRRVLVTDSDRGVRVVTLNDPGNRNAIDLQMMAALLAAVEETDARTDLRALVITGAGSSFCAGAALHALPAALDAASSVGPALIPALHELRQPSFAAVNGPAYGLGLGLALACDFRVVGRSGRFNSAFVRHALVPADGSAWLLPRVVGPSRALWMQLFADSVDAEEALRIGLADQLVEDDDLLGATLRWATRLAGGPAATTALIKELVAGSRETDLRRHMMQAAAFQQTARVESSKQSAGAASS